MQSRCKAAGKLAALSMLAFAFFAVDRRDHHQRVIEELAVNQKLDLKRLFGKDVSGACLLPPYASTLAPDPSQSDFVLLVNEHLLRTGHVGSEDLWTIVAEHDGKLQTYQVRRTGRSDIGATAPLQVAKTLFQFSLTSDCFRGSWSCPLKTGQDQVSV